MSFIFIYVTTKDEQEANRIAEVLLEKKLIACANFFPMKSMYHWDGKIEKGKEFVLILKTKEEKFKEVKEEVKKIHSYDVPCIIKIKVEVDEKYGEWMKTVLT